ncbi:hypothetical protein ZWY2020_051422 [Hordeum vulgare]|nr:hypothetical protein ZWY2020_051422 [Hordeum vulgare]
MEQSDAELGWGLLGDAYDRCSEVEHELKHSSPALHSCNLSLNTTALTFMMPFGLGAAIRSRVSSIKPPPQKKQLSGIKTSILSAGNRIGRAVGDVFVHLRIDDVLDIAYVRHYRRISYIGCPTAADNDAESKQGTVVSPELILHDDFLPQRATP